MNYERLPSEGGIRIFDDVGRETISRLGLDGETRVSFPGLSFDYDKEGNLVFTRMRVLEYLTFQESENLSDGLSRLIGYFETIKADMIIKVDLAQGLFELSQVNKTGETKDQIFHSLLDDLEGKHIQVSIEGGGMFISDITFVVRRESSTGNLILGTGDDESGLFVTRQALKVNLWLLEGDFDGEEGMARMRTFLEGDAGNAKGR